MAEYIEREALLLEITERIARIAFTSPYQREMEAIVVGMERARDSVEDAPAADVAHVVHGRWEDKPTGAYGRWQSWCSACGKHSGIGGIESNRHKPYCPNCGARMDGE